MDGEPRSDARSEGHVRRGRAAAWTSHVRHNHPFSEEILYVLSGVGEQMVDDKPPFEVRSGDTIYVPTAIFHATCNTGWEPLRLLALYNPGGAERALVDLPDYRSTPSGEVLGLRRNQA
jgi:oxalate decarboxylase/phosphoglucose isomerase-like protein (cupin superfamily)